LQTLLKQLDYEGDDLQNATYCKRHCRSEKLWQYFEDCERNFCIRLFDVSLQKLHTKTFRNI